MVKSSSKPKENPNPPNVDTLQSDIASFASSIGLNDSDIHKSGPLKPKQSPNKPNHEKYGKKIPIQNRNNPKNSKNEFNKPKQQPRAQKPASQAEFSIPNSNSKVVDKFKNLPKLPLIKASSLGVWYEDLEEMEARVIGEDRTKMEAKSGEMWKAIVEKKRGLGERLLMQYTQDYEASEGKKGDIRMLISTQGSGTASDKVSACSVLVQENPIANMKSLDTLLGMVTSKVGKRHALTGFDALKELFVIRLLPDRKLKALLQRPVNHVPETKDGNSLLLLWYWEECLKQRYERFIIALEEGSRDVLAVLKDKSLKMMYGLLRSKSEQERRLLCALVNKLGDPQNKGASNADFHLSNLLADHPNMTAIVIDEVDTFLFRPHLGLRSKYHAVNFLSQIRLHHHGDGPKVAKRLIDVYFALFKVLISEASGGQNLQKNRKARDTKASKTDKNKKSFERPVEMDSRLLSALLTGVNRAFPYVSSNEADDVIEVQTPMLFQLVHSENFNVGVQALMLLDKLVAKNQIVSDRFYRALYSKLILPAAMKSSKAEMFIGLIARAMKSDVNLKRVSAFSKRMLQVALQQTPEYACGILFLLSEVLKARPPLWNMVLQNESNNDDDLEHFEDIVDETEKEPQIASKRLQSNAGSTHVSDKAVSDDDDDSQNEYDIPVESNALLVTNTSKDLHGEKTNTASLGSSLPGGYIPRHREPSYCNADRVSWWELTVLASHVHPSVATMAGTLLSGANIVYNGNPLKDLSLAAFLDKFMEKKPKASVWHGASQIEPAKQLDMNHHLIGPEILSLAEMDVPPEDLVFHKFYANKMTISKKQKKKKKKRDTEDEAAEELYGVDNDGGDDDSDNDEIDNMLDSTTVVSDGEYDYDEIANEDDEDLVGDGSDMEMDCPSDIDEGEDDDIDATGEDDLSEDDNDINEGDADDGSGDEEDATPNKRKRRRTAKRKAGESPFASLEEYEHLMKEDSSLEKKGSKKKHKPNKKKKEDSPVEKEPSMESPMSQKKKKKTKQQ